MLTFRKLRYAALGIGLVCGLVLLAAGFLAAFGLTAASNYWDVLGLVLGCISLLPLTILSYFKPRVASLALVLASIVFSIFVVVG
jgi:hypothetical protein